MCVSRQTILVFVVLSVLLLKQVAVQFKSRLYLQLFVCLLHANPHISVCQSGAACPWLINAPDSLFNLFAGPSRASYGDPDVTPANLPSVRLNSSAVIYLEGQRRGKRGPQKWFVSLRRESKPRSQLVRVCASDWDVRVWRRAPIGPFKWKWQFRWNYFTSTFAGCFCVFQKHPAVIYDYIYHQNSDGCTSLYPP